MELEVVSELAVQSTAEIRDAGNADSFDDRRNVEHRSDDHSHCNSSVFWDYVQFDKSLEPLALFYDWVKLYFHKLIKSLVQTAQ